ncbi:hypothetical protein [Nocardia sp. NPDC057030]|uniref:hypothetical protein n=1 Tax=unclassified Nocardia TaxID=2637762 RepID=UPI003645A025
MSKRMRFTSWEHAKRRRRICRALDTARQFFTVLTVILLTITACNYLVGPFLRPQAAALVFGSIGVVVVAAIVLHVELKRRQRR